MRVLHFEAPLKEGVVHVVLPLRFVEQLGQVVSTVSSYELPQVALQKREMMSLGVPFIGGKFPCEYKERHCDAEKQKLYLQANSNFD